MWGAVAAKPLGICALGIASDHCSSRPKSPFKASALNISHSVCSYFPIGRPPYLCTFFRCMMYSESCLRRGPAIPRSAGVRARVRDRVRRRPKARAVRGRGRHPPVAGPGPALGPTDGRVCRIAAASAALRTPAAPRPAVPGEPRFIPRKKAEVSNVDSSSKADSSNVRGPRNLPSRGTSPREGGREKPVDRGGTGRRDRGIQEGLIFRKSNRRY